jgi:DNA-binding GntR family transcriptional regulator
VSRPEPSAVDTTVAFLGEAIIAGNYRAGDRVVEAEIVGRYDVSRTTARAAIQVLATRGLVSSPVGRRAARVTALSDDDGASLLHLRGILEPLLIHRFAQRAEIAQIAALDRAMEHFAEVARSSDALRRIYRARDAFYEVLFDGAASLPLEQAIRSEYAQLGAFRRDRLSGEQELRRVRRNAAVICRVVPRISERACSAASGYSQRMLIEDGAATLRTLAASA